MASKTAKSSVASKDVPASSKGKSAVAPADGSGGGSAGGSGGTGAPDASQADASQLAGGSVVNDVGSRMDDPAASGAGNSVAALSMLGQTLAGFSLGEAPAGTDADGASRRPPSRRSRTNDDGTPVWLGKRVGRFRLIGLIGRGAMGKVFRAEDVQLHRQVALKVVSSRGSHKRTAAQKLELFLREARSAAKLEHPNIVSVYEVASAADIHFIAMELVEGGNLKDLVSAAGPLDVPRACQLAAECAEALQHAHDLNVVHRDVKPANLMLTRTGRCKLGDFGLARIDDGYDTGDGGLGPRVGTPQYVAPEVINGQDATELSDVYSLGATLFFLLTGVPPFTGADSREIMRKHLEEMPPDVRTFRPDVPESLALAVWRALAKDPTARWESAGHFARALRLHTIHTGGHADRTHSVDGHLSPNGLPAGAVVRSTTKPRVMALVGVLGGGLLVAMVIGGASLAGRSGSPRTSTMVPTTLPTLPSTQPGDAAALAAAALQSATAPATAAVAPPPPATPHDVDPPAPVLPAPDQRLDPTDTPTLLLVARLTDPARHDGWVTVEGNVQRLSVPRWYPGPSSVAVEFRGVDRKLGLACVVEPAALSDLLPPPLQAAGVRPGAAEPRVRVTGQVEQYDGRPMIVVRSPGQLTVVSPTTWPTVIAPTTAPATQPVTRPPATLPAATRPATRPTAY